MSNQPLLTAVGLLGSVTATSYVLFSNLGVSQYGLIPFIQGKLVDVKLSGSDKAKTWLASYENGKKYSVGGAITGALCGIIVATTHPALEIQRLGLGSAMLGLAIMPYTLIAIMPTNKELMALQAKAEKGENVDASAVDNLVEKWKSLHYVRFVSYAGAWLLSMAALALNGNLVVDVVDVVYNVAPVA